MHFLLVNRCWPLQSLSTLQISKTGAQESFQAVFEIANISILFDETPFSERTSGSLTSCTLQFTRDKRCKSANFIKSEEMCSLMDKTRRTHPLLFQKQDNIIHLQKVWQIIREYNTICSPDTGSLVEWRTGNITCKIAKHVTDTCLNELPPSYLRAAGFCGPSLKNNAGVQYYYLSCCTSRGTPKHNPCNTGEDNRLRNVENPHGNIFVR